MPYHIGEKGSYDCAGYPVVKDEDNSVVTCHKTLQDAKDHLTALNIHVVSQEKSADGFVPPKGAQENARRGLELREEFKRGGTMVGVARARDISNGRSLPLKTINRMVSYFARHEVDKKGKDWGNASNPSRGYIAWLLWGGDAGKTWADSIAEREKKKDKSMTTDLAHSYAKIIKQEKQNDGTLLVYGKATDDALDIDQQICDAGWLDKAMPDWFKTGGNIREQHSNIAAGVAKELDSKADGHYISALIVDPVSVKKVETGVLKGFSIGIRDVRIVRDTKAANGRIIDGQIVEISLVDRPANPNAKLMLAKSDNAGTLEQVEEFVEKKEEPDYENINRGGKGSEPSDTELYNRVKREAKAKFDVYPSAVANAWVTNEYKKRGGGYKKKDKSVTENIEKEQERDERGRFGSGGGDSSSSDRDSSEREEDYRINSDARNDSLLSEEFDNLGGAADRAEDLESEIINANGGEETDESRAAGQAAEHINDAGAVLQEATETKDDAEHERLVSEAREHLNAASQLLTRIDTNESEDIMDRLGDTDMALEDYSDELLGKSAKTTTTKERAMARTKRIAKSMHEDEDKVVAEKPSKEDLMKQYEECKMNYMAAEKALEECKSMCKEAGIEVDDEEKREYGEGAEEETAEGSKPEAASEEVAEAEGKKPLNKADTGDCDCAGCKDCAEKGGCDKAVCDGHEETKSAEKCLDCGCHKPEDAHGRDDVSTATMVSPTGTPKSATTILPRIDVDGNDIADDGTEQDSSDDEDLSKKTITAIIEKAVKSAKDAITIEVNSYQEEINKLNAELATAKTKAVSGGPKRSVIKPAVIAELGDLLQKAAEYRAKSVVTEDKDLARGYKELASDFEAKALAVQANK